MGYSLRPETIEAISMAQTSTNLTPEESECVKIQEVQIYLKSGNPRLIKKGKAILRRINNRKFVKSLRRQANKLKLLGDYDVTLLAERRTEFIKQIEKRNNETTTPMP